MNLILPCLMNQAQRGRLCIVPETGKLFQNFPCDRRQAVQLAEHEIDNIVCVALGPNALEIPDPGGHPRIEREESFLGQGAEKLDRKEWIAAGLLVYKRGQRLRPFPLAVQCVGDELVKIVELEGRKYDLAHRYFSLLDRRYRPHERMRGTNLVAAISTNQ
jgi:hypothetical protein